MKDNLDSTVRKTPGLVGTLLSLIKSPTREREPRLDGESAIAEWLVQRIARETGTPPSEIDSHASFADFGLDSRTAVSLSSELEKLLGQELPPTLIWDFPTIDEASKHLASLVRAPANPS
jgi:acyl carrier protein